VREGNVMRNGIFLRFALFLVTALLSGCIAVPFLPLIPIMGSAYEGYVIWKGGEATKYYAYDIDTTYRAVTQTAGQLKIEATLTKPAPKEGYSVETKGHEPMHIDILPREKNITAVIIKISRFGDKHYVELFYSVVDDYLPRKAAGSKGKTPLR
jgi:hypothetical protein